VTNGFVTKVTNGFVTNGCVTNGLVTSVGIRENAKTDRNLAERKKI
jgi:hypothetical protein